MNKAGRGLFPKACERCRLESASFIGERLVDLGFDFQLLPDSGNSRGGDRFQRVGPG